MKNRLELIQHFGELGFKVGAEIGTCYGVFAEKMYKNIPGLTLFAIDNWSNPETERRERVHERHVETWARNALANYGAIIIKMDSVEAARYVADGSLDFVYIDGDHTYKGAKADIEAWAPKVRIGGIVSGDDYYDFPSGRGGVIPAVDEYVALHNIELHTTPWDKENPDRDERQPAWWFIK